MLPPAKGPLLKELQRTWFLGRNIFRRKVRHAGRNGEQRNWQTHRQGGLPGHVIGSAVQGPFSGGGPVLQV